MGKHNPNLQATVVPSTDNPHEPNDLIFPYLSGKGLTSKHLKRFPHEKYNCKVLAPPEEDSQTNNCCKKASCCPQTIAGQIYHIAHSII